jgi:HEAT repeat protein
VDDLARLIERLGGRDWRDVGAAVETLRRAGAVGREAAVRGLLHHPDARVRRGCADFMDHHGDDDCVPALVHAAQYDPIAYVRRVAVHSLGCQRCKVAPLATDFVNFLIERIAAEPNVRARREAVYALGQQCPDDRTRAALHGLRRDRDGEVGRSAHFALRRHDPDYRKAVDERARSQAMARHAAQARFREPEAEPEP